MQPDTALTALPAIVATDFLQNSCEALVHRILDNPPLIGPEANLWILSPPSITGEEPTSSDKPTSKLDAISFISQQLLAPKCI